VSERDENPGGRVFAIGLGAFVLIMGVLFAWGQLRSPDGARNAWLSGAHLVVEEFRLDEGDEDERIAVLDPATGKRLADRDPGELTAFGVVNGRLWLSRRREPYGLEAWSLPDLKTAISVDLQLAESSLCTDFAAARLKKTDGRYTVVDLSDGKVVADRAVGCAELRRSAADERTGRYGTQAEASSERRVLVRDEVRLGGSETFLEPRFLAGLELEGDAFVVHRAALGENRQYRLSRVGEGAVKWTAELHRRGDVERAFLVPPSTLVVVAHSGIVAVDAKTGTALWRTGN